MILSKTKLLGYLCLLLLICGCTDNNSNHFIGTWIQSRDAFGNELSSESEPRKLKILKTSIYYTVNANFDADGELIEKRTLKPFPDAVGKYVLSEDKMHLVSMIGPVFTLKYFPEEEMLLYEPYGIFEKQ